MGNLHIEAKPACRTVRHAGNEVLRIFYPVIGGNTKAAAHTAALIEALVAHGEQTVGAAAAEALHAAASEGRLFDFACHTYQITAKVEQSAHYAKIALTAQYTAGSAADPARTLTTYWDQSEALQRKHPPRKCHEKFYRFLLRARKKYAKI